MTLHAILLLATTLWWSVFHPVDLDSTYMKRVADKAVEYGDVAGFEVCGDCHSPYGGINGLSLLEPYPTARSKVDPGFGFGGDSNWDSTGTDRDSTGTDPNEVADSRRFAV